MTPEYQQFEVQATLSERGSGIEAKMHDPQVQKALIQEIKSLYTEMITGKSRDGNIIVGKKELVKIESDIKLLGDWLVVGNIGLVGNVLRKFTSDGNNILTYQDLFQEGLIGLIKAVSDVGSKYNFKKGEFSTYASKYIEGTIIRAIQDKGGSGIRYPNGFQERVRSYNRAIAVCGSDAPAEKIALEMNISVNQLNNFLKISKEMPIVIPFSDYETEKSVVDDNGLGDGRHFHYGRRRNYIARTSETIASRKIQFSLIFKNIRNTLNSKDQSVWDGWEDFFGIRKPQLSIAKVAELLGISEQSAKYYRTQALFKAKPVLEKLASSGND